MSSNSVVNRWQHL